MWPPAGALSGAAPAAVHAPTTATAPTRAAQVDRQLDAVDADVDADTTGGVVDDLLAGARRGVVAVGPTWR